GVVNVPMGMQCTAAGGKVCDDIGGCVECLGDGDCQGVGHGTCDVTTKKCTTCYDGALNGDEKDVDCDGSCALKCRGDACTGAGECISGNCVDGVCCDTPCADTCKACNVPGMAGTCTALNKGLNGKMCSDPTMQACDGAGNCMMLPAGQGA